MFDGLAHVGILVVELDVVVGLDPDELLRPRRGVVGGLRELRQEGGVGRAVHDQQRGRRDERRLGHRVEGQVRLERGRGGLPRPAGGVVARGALVVAVGLGRRHDRDRDLVAQLLGDRRHVLRLARFPLAIAQLVDGAQVGGESLGAHHLLEGAADVVAPGHAHARGEPALAGGRREGEAAPHAHADRRDAAGVDVVAAHQIGGRVDVVVDDQPGVVVKARLALALAETARVEGEHRVPRVREALRIVRKRLLLDTRHRAGHDDARSRLGSCAGGWPVEVGGEPPAVALERDGFAPRRVGYEQLGGVLGKPGIAIGHGPHAAQRRLGQPVTGLPGIARTRMPRAQ